jgi:hypothetical protein
MLIKILPKKNGMINGEELDGETKIHVEYW